MPDKWTDSFLVACFHLVRIGPPTSNKFLVLNGVLQGRILGPVYCLLYKLMTFLNYGRQEESQVSGLLMTLSYTLCFKM